MTADEFIARLNLPDSIRWYRVVDGHIAWCVQIQRTRSERWFVWKEPGTATVPEDRYAMMNSDFYDPEVIGTIPRWNEADIIPLMREQLMPPPPLFHDLFSEEWLDCINDDLLPRRYFLHAVPLGNDTAPRGYVQYYLSRLGSGVVIGVFSFSLGIDEALSVFTTATVISPYANWHQPQARLMHELRHLIAMDKHR